MYELSWDAEGGYSHSQPASRLNQYGLGVLPDQSPNQSVVYARYDDDDDDDDDDSRDDNYDSELMMILMILMMMMMIIHFFFIIVTSLMENRYTKTAHRYYQLLNGYLLVESKEYVLV